MVGSEESWEARREDWESCEEDLKGGLVGRKGRLRGKVGRQGNEDREAGIMFRRQERRASEAEKEGWKAWRSVGLQG